MHNKQKGFTLFELIFALFMLFVPIAILAVVVHFLIKFW